MRAEPVLLDPNLLASEPPTHPTQTSPKARPSSERFLALDAFRGLTILGMLVVNNVSLGVLTPPLLAHAEWSGAITIADLVFPWFLLAMGIAAGLSRQPVPLRRVFTRVAVLVVLGMFLDSVVRKQPTAGLGVLQLIGLAYGVASLARRWPTWMQAVLVGGGLAVHTLLLLRLPLPGGVIGSITESSNAIRALNEPLTPWGLRGLPSVLTTAPLAILGSWVGLLLRDVRSGRRRQWWGIVGVGGAMLAVGAIVQSSVPALKPIWTTSYVLLTGGMGIFAFLAFALVDRWRGTRWVGWLLALLGANALVLYVAPILVKLMVLQVWTVPAGPQTGQTLWRAGHHALIVWRGPWEGPLLFLFGYVLIWWAVAYLLWRNRIHVRV